MDTEKRVLIAIVLSLAVLMLWPYLMNRLYPPPPPPPPTEAPAERVGKDEPARAVREAPVWPEATPPPVAPPPPAAEPVQEVLVTVETPLYKAVLTSLGGAIKSMELKNYKVTLGGSEGVDIAATIAGISPLQTGIISTGFPELIPFEPSRERLVLTEGEEGKLVLSFVSPEGVRVEKSFTFSADGYSIGTELVVLNDSRRKVTGEVQTLLTAAYDSQKASYFHHGPLWHVTDEAERQDADKALESGRGKLNWLGLEDKYFLRALMPGKGAEVKWDSEILSIDTSRASLYEAFGLAPGEEMKYVYNAYLGPKHYDTLLSFRTGLEEAIEFGFFSFMAKPFLVVLNFFQRFLINYGLAIILLTCIIKVVFHPLTKHSLQSMREMQKIQPQLQALKQKYKDDKEKLNKEMMELYKRNKINPLGGCLPMILQIPVFIALYEVLSVAIELRHAPFIFWITDLSSKDPLYITPVLMGVSMLIQQKMSPTSMDPSQAKIMLIMPVVFTFLFLSFPSGLVLYWLVNNVLSIAQQYHIYKGKK
jgi:YidC/Oxa1 family membrane protein insertase